MSKRINDRGIEIDLLLDDENLPRAIIRLLDFVQDFSTNATHVNTALEISTSQKQVIRDQENQTITYEQALQRTAEIIQRIRQLKQDIADVYLLAVHVNAQNTRQVQTETAELTNVAGEEFKEAMPILMECFGLSKYYRKSGFSLSGIDLHLRLGEITGVVGENGNGKTTLFKVITGNLQHDAGVIAFPLLQKHQISKDKVDWIEVKSEIAYVEQELPSWHGTLKQNIHLELAQHGIKGAYNEQNTAYILERLGLTEHADKKWSELSGGYKLRFALAKALVWRPKMLVIDEPLANLDVRSQRIVLNDLKDLAKSAKYPISIIISSQHLHEIESIADNLMFLQKGRMVFSGDKNNIGDARLHNFFELSCVLEKRALESLLTGLPVSEIEHNGLSYVITGSKELDGQKILETLVQNNVEVEYFRNISNSAKRLFL
ncbi:ABC transporter ATP-binding protein [Microscilla marina]|uniref:Probable ABC transporter, putative n=1 Tax=Microscilla marina ATCC 23134 TaxID=313606 RepID=A1ZKX7_MICM2|nr:ABC transporter ATP-binding protein [Microscilla marina]EAY28943.1 probable ABC transporter, putative [Microscilla marina ATCC 23134]